MSDNVIERKASEPFRRSILLVAIVATTCVAFSHLVLAQTEVARGNVWGRVVGNDMQPWPGVVVVAQHVATDRRFSSKPTDSQGSFFLGSVPAGVYIFSLDDGGAEYSVEPYVDGRSDVDFVLHASFRIVGENAVLFRDEADVPAPVAEKEGEEPRLERGQAVEPQPISTEQVGSSGEISPLAEAGQLLQSERYSEAATAFGEYFQTSHFDKFTIALAVYCDYNNISRAVEDSGASEQLFILARGYPGGQACYGVFWGTFDTHADAQHAIGEVPAAVRQPDSQPIPISRLLQGRPST